MEGQFRWGDNTSADLKLWLTGLNGEKYQRNPVYLHSPILKRSEFFQVMMSERWSSGKPTKISVTTSHNFDDYLKCIQFMYDEPVYFSNVEECLTLLSVASELLVDVCIKKCMQYLEAVRWNAEQEFQIRNVLSSLGLKPLPDLAARFDKEGVDHRILEHRMINLLFSFIKDGQATETNVENAQKYIMGIFEGNTSKDIKVCGGVLLREFKSAIGSFKFPTISLLFKFIEHCDGEILKAAYLAFCEDIQCTKRVREWNEVVKTSPSVFNNHVVKIPKYKYNHLEENVEVVIYTIIWFMKATGDGKIIISRASRISFLKTWLQIVKEFCYGKLDELPFKSSTVFSNALFLRSVFKFIEQCDEAVLKAAFIEFCEDPKFTEHMKAFIVFCEGAEFREKRSMCQEFREDVSFTITWFMQAIGDGKIIISRDSRISFLTTWLPIMAELCCERPRKLGQLERQLGELDKAAVNVVESLPLIDRRRICMLWTKVYKKYDIDIATPLTLFKCSHRNVKK
ncbi:hypothetical protein SUGI_1012640 [Cryptomeria japonica]|uniref:uncharacterized protein LOC131056602 n=1 Tax=Cryptomeria japonica TaxID=3369 RepID=UPI00241487A1|nr:uncharacterized protein LOC131056602 [Cryptomeria japonica]GLJ47957.1 hypothetical protein SUGI_1012640 [Cryptomeria japonica]